MEKLDLLTTSEAAEFLGVTRRRVVAMITAGKLSAQRAGSGQRPIYFISREDLDAVRDRKPGRPFKKAETAVAPVNGKAKKKGKAQP